MPKSMAKKPLKSTSNKRGGHPLPPRVTSSSSERSRERAAERSRSNHQHNTYRQNLRPPSRGRDRGHRRSRSSDIKRRTHNTNTLTPAPPELPQPTPQPLLQPRPPPAGPRNSTASTMSSSASHASPRPLTSLSCKPKPLRTHSPPRSYRRRRHQRARRCSRPSRTNPLQPAHSPACPPRHHTRTPSPAPLRRHHPPRPRPAAAAHYRERDRRRRGCNADDADGPCTGVEHCREGDVPVSPAAATRCCSRFSCFLAYRCPCARRRAPHHPVAHPDLSGCGGCGAAVEQCRHPPSLGAAVIWVWVCWERWSWG